MFRQNLFSKALLVFSLNFILVNCCYFNADCPYQLFGSKTPYDPIRGDLRDYKTPENCEVVSIWTINRHGNRNPGTSVTVGMREIAGLKDEIISSHEAGTSQLCAQDIENFKKWTWNDTLDVSQSYLTGIGYEEVYDIGKRHREKYPQLLQGTADQFYCRPTNEQRTVTSCMAFVHGLTDGIDLNVTVEDPWDRDDVIRPYQNCERYMEDVRGGQVLADKIDSYFKSADYQAVQKAVQERLGISTQLDTDNIFSIYELCRFYRSWSPNLQSPWCAAFTDEELLVLEYYDDVRHYYRNGYGSWVNVNLGKTALKDLYENFEAAVNGTGRKLVAYFTHDTMMEMVYCAMGLYGEDEPLQSDVRDDKREWRTSYIGAMSVNIMAVLNSCNEANTQTYRVQLFVNEKPTALCPLEGCTWLKFQDKFQIFTASDLSFCSMDYIYEVTETPSHNSGSFLISNSMLSLFVVFLQFYIQASF